MGYRDDFYVAANMIGYTGAIHKMPSVYFLKGKEFGHITQFHPLPLNIGRESVYERDTYSIKNETTAGGMACVERANGKAFHTSRSLFVEAATLTEEQRSVLLQSIVNFQELKMIKTLTHTDRAAVDRQYDHKLNTLNAIDGGRR